MFRRLLVLTIAALLALALAGPPAMLRTAQAAGPGMTLAAPASVAVGETFTVSINADPAPDVEIEGFGAEVLFPNGLTWLPRPNCEGPGPEGAVQVVRQDGEPLVLCKSYLSVLNRGAVHWVISAFSRPLPPLDVAPGSTTTLVELELRCEAPGAYDLVLTANPDSPDGALYADLSAREIRVKMMPFDVDGDTTPENVADVLTVDCGCPADPCPTPAPLLPAVLSLESDCSPDVIRPNEAALFICKTTVINSGGVTATRLLLTRGTSQLYRIGLTVNGHSRLVGLFDVSEILQVAPGQPVEIESRVVLRAESEGSYEANLHSFSIGNGGWSASDTVSYDVAAGADYPPTNLAISKTLLTEIEPLQVYETLEYELVVTNIGAIAMSSVTIVDKHDDLVQTVDTDPAATSVDDFIGLVTWELGPLAPGEEVRLRETVGSDLCPTTVGVMVVTAETETGMEENYALVEREPVRVGDQCSVVALPGRTNIDDSFGGDSSEVAGLAFGGDSTDMSGLFTGSIVRAPITGAGPTASTGSPPLWAAVALAMAGVVALAVGAQQTRRRER